MIRRQVLLRVKRNSVLNYNYKHAVASMLYAVGREEAEESMTQLHDKGYDGGEGFRFKLFTHTILFKNAEFKQDGIHISKGTEVRLLISGKDEIVTTLMKTLHLGKELDILGVKFEVDAVERDRHITFKRVMCYKALAPVVTSQVREGKRVCLDYWDVEYFRIIAEKAKRQYKMIYGEEYEGDLFFEIDNTETAREKGEKLKNSFIRGYQYDLWVEAAPKMQKILYFLGIGEKVTQGFGFLSQKRGEDIREQEL